MKKIVILVILICSTGFFLSACSSKDSTKSTIISQSSTTEKSYSSIEDKTNSTSEKSFDVSNIATDNNNLNVYFLETLNNPFYDIVKAQTAYNDITATKYLKINYKNSESTIAWSIHIWNSEGNVADYNLQDTNSFGYYYNINIDDFNEAKVLYYIIYYVNSDGNWIKDGTNSDRIIDLNNSNYDSNYTYNIYILENNPTTYYNLDDINFYLNNNLSFVYTRDDGDYSHYKLHIWTGSATLDLAFEEGTQNSIINVRLSDLKAFTKSETIKYLIYKVDDEGNPLYDEFHNWIIDGSNNNSVDLTTVEFVDNTATIYIQNETIKQIKMDAL